LYDPIKLKGERRYSLSCPRHESVEGSKDIVLLILNLGLEEGRYSAPHHGCYRCRERPQKKPEPVWTFLWRENVLPFPEFEPRIVKPVA
jgi:hypothetical protein